jgi:guanine deaminase
MNQFSPEYYRDESTEQSIQNNIATIQYIKSLDPDYSLISPIITPRFAPSCSSDLLYALSALAKEENLPIQTHMSENLAEVSLVKELFPNHDSYAHVYDDHGLLTPRTILAHCVHITAPEIELCAKKGAGIAHCPISNTGLTSGEAKVRWMIEGGVKVGLGTDCSGGYSSSILECARQASNVSRHVCMKSTFETEDSPELALAEIIYLATMGGARVCSLEDRVGNFIVGKEFDALLIDPSVEEGNVDLFEDDFGDWDRILSKWAFNGYFSFLRVLMIGMIGILGKFGFVDDWFLDRTFCGRIEFIFCTELSGVLISRRFEELFALDV